jgi:hypothetical protein
VATLPLGEKNHFLSFTQELLSLEFLRNHEILLNETIFGIYVHYRNLFSNSLIRVDFRVGFGVLA